MVNMSVRTRITRTPGSQPAVQVTVIIPVPWSCHYFLPDPRLPSQL